jgi:transcriptional regulator with XRE-family HTH domain
VTYDQVINFYLTQRRVAEAAGVGQSAVSNWRTRGRGIPHLCQLRLEAESKGALKASKDALKPHKGKFRISHE